jgi:hypothetical protein
MPVVGSSCVSPNGSRLGKGEGFAEVEYGILRLLGVVDENTPIVTTVGAPVLGPLKPTLINLISSKARCSSQSNLAPFQPCLIPPRQVHDCQVLEGPDSVPSEKMCEWDGEPRGGAKTGTREETLHSVR